MSWKEIEITDMDIFQKAFGNIKSQASEMSFANMFMWRKNYNTKFSIINNMLCMVANPRKYKPFAFCPIPLDTFNPEEFEDTVFKLKEYFDSQDWKLFFGRVEECMVERFKKYLKVNIKAKKMDSISDYVYDTESLITLAGKKLSSKRNHINRFLREYGGFEYVEISNENFSECERIFDEWCEGNDSCNCDVPEECEKWACSQLLKYWDKIPGLKGALIKVNGRAEAFTIGEMLNDDTAVIHIEKGNADIHGIYAIINREFVERTFSHTKYINREEDMGIEGLRKAKLSYKPSGRVWKYNIYPEF
ncbi:MAG: DUF2156 domain-containing protein [Clostridiaceae bacterium]|nr:DUF2156 domain-containing protein [Clostridiaceae bacterium]